MRSRSQRRSRAQGLLLLAPALWVLAGGCGGEPDRSSEEETIGERCFFLTAQVEQWRELVEKYFKKQHVTWALNIIKCESGGDPNAKNASSGASGLFQHMPQYWPARAKAAGFPGASPFEPEANIAASAYLLYAAGGGPQHWSCKFSPYEDFGYQPQFYDNGVPVTKPPEEPPPQPPASATCPALPAAGGIVDDTSPCFELNGPAEYWHAVDGEGHGQGLLWTDAITKDTSSNWARWKLNLAAAGTYRIKYYAVEAYAKFNATRYLVRHRGQETPLTVDQSTGGTGWRTLGTFDFDAGADAFVAIYDNVTTTVPKGQHIVADAIKLEPAGAEAPTPQQPGPTGPEAPSSTTDATPPGNPTVILGGCSVSQQASDDVPIPVLLLFLLGILRRPLAARRRTGQQPKIMRW